MGFKLSVSTNIDEVLASLDRFVAQAEEVAGARTLNKLIDQAATAGLAVAASIYGLSTRKLNEYLVRKYASRGARVVTLAIRGKGLPLALFNPRPGKAGVTVTIKGKRILIEHSFMARMASGHLGVFARGAYGGKSSKRPLRPTGQRFGGAFVYGRGRLPINELFTVSVPVIFRNDAVVRAMVERVQEQAGKVFAQELRYARGGR